MISIKQINEKDIDLCYELDSNTISLWSKEQWANEFKKDRTKIFGLLIKNLDVSEIISAGLFIQKKINSSLLIFNSFLIKKATSDSNL